MKKERKETKKGPRQYYHISSVAKMYSIHPQTLRLYEREGLLTPSRSEGNTRLYSAEDLKRLELILNLIRDLGVNLAGVEVILNMRAEDRADRGRGQPVPRVRPAGVLPGQGGRVRGPETGPGQRQARRRRQGREPRQSEHGLPGFLRIAGTSSTTWRRSPSSPRSPRRRRGSWARRIRQGDAEALQTLIKSNLKFVVSYVKKYRGMGLGLLDLIDEGNVGLIEAAKRFDPTRHVRFISYAVWWIRQAIIHALTQYSRIFNIPQKLSDQISQMKKKIAELKAELGREPTREEIAEAMKISEVGRRGPRDPGREEPLPERQVQRRRPRGRGPDQRPGVALGRIPDHQGLRPAADPGDPGGTG